jgi:hypothetical protein
MDPKEVGWEGMRWISLVQDRDQWRALVNTVMNADWLLKKNSAQWSQLLVQVTFILGVKERYADLCSCMKIVNSLEKISEGTASYEAQATWLRIAALEFATHRLSIYSNVQTTESRLRPRLRTAQQVVDRKKEQ